jgi:hypothetical protein
MTHPPSSVSKKLDVHTAAATFVATNISPSCPSTVAVQNERGSTHLQTAAAHIHVQSSQEHDAVGMPLYCYCCTQYYACMH